MRRLLIGILLLAMALPAIAQTRVDTIRQHLMHPGDGTVLVAAHRGDWRNAPENSLEAVESAIQLGVDIVEIDVRKTLDGTLILMHNPTINATTTGRGIVRLSSYRRIQKKYLRSGCRLSTRAKVPTLEEVLISTKGRVMLNLDKAFGYFDDIVALAEKTGTLDQLIFKSSKRPKKVEKILGDYKDKVLFMPIIHMSDKYARADIETFIGMLHPQMFEIIYDQDDDPTMAWLRDTLRGSSRIWYNTLWDDVCGGHGDDRSFYEGPEAGYGFLIDTMEAGAIQTDRSALLIEYLAGRSCLAAPTPRKRLLWMQ